MENVQITRNERDRRGIIDEKRIREDIARVAGAANFKIDPRQNFHLDTTKIFHPVHRDRVEAWYRGERVAPITMDMALTQKCSFSCTYCYAGLQYNKAAPTNWVR